MTESSNNARAMLDAAERKRKDMENLHTNLGSQSGQAGGVYKAPPTSHPPPFTRLNLLSEVANIVAQDRATDYGTPEDSFSAIAGLWTAFRAAQQKDPTAVISPDDVPLYMILLKVARLAANPLHHDSVVDIAGYAACLAEIQELKRADIKAFSALLDGSASP